MLLKACKACQLWLKPPWKNTNKQLICTILAGKQLFVMVFPRMYWVEKLLRLNFSSEAILQLFDIQLIITKSILYDIWKSIFKILRYTSSVCFNIPMLFMTCKSANCDLQRLEASMEKHNKQLICTILVGKQLFVMLFQRKPKSWETCKQTSCKNSINIVISTQAIPKTIQLSKQIWPGAVKSRNAVECPAHGTSRARISCDSSTSYTCICGRAHAVPCVWPFTELPDIPAPGYDQEPIVSGHVLISWNNTS